MRRALTLIVALAWVTPAAADDVVLARAPGATNLTGGAGSLVWSAPIAGGWALMHYRDGVVTQLPVKQRSQPFDADVGTDRDGLPTVVYSRCVGEMADGCSIYALRLDAAGGERRVGDLDYQRHAASETAPAIHRGAIAYSSRRGEEPFPRLLLRAANGHVRELSAGPRQNEGGRATIEDTDLGPGGAAYVWRMSGGLLYGVGDATELRFAPASGRMSVLLDSGLLAEGCGEYRVYAPTVGTSRIDYLTAGLKCTAQTEFAAYDLRTGFRMHAPMPSVAAGHAGGGGARFWLRAPAEGTFPCQPYCDLMLSRDVALSNDRRVRGTGPAEFAEIPGHRWVRGRGGARLLRPPARVECIPRRGGVLVSVGAIDNQRRLERCGRMYRLTYKASGTRHTFTVRVLKP